MRARLTSFLALSLLIPLVIARIHKFDIKNDARGIISLSTFGYFENGLLDVKIINFRATPFNESDLFGFSLERTFREAMNRYTDNREKCALQGTPKTKSDYEPRDDAVMIYFTFDLKNLLLKIKCGSNKEHLPDIYKDSSQIRRSKRDLSKLGDSAPSSNKKNSDVSPQETGIAPGNAKEADQEANSCNQNLPMVVREIGGIKYYNTSFAMYVVDESQEGLYNLHFHNCPSSTKRVTVDFSTRIIERNGDNYLSAGEMPLPEFYLVMSILFFLSGCLWVYILNKSNNPVYKIHYLMAVLVYLKSLSLFFHSINYHFIQVKGAHVAAWAILYYIIRLLKGALLFITIPLVGTGWIFIKHILSDRDKKLFMIVIPLQILANVAEIITEESEEGDIEYNNWHFIFLAVDMVCCLAVMVPVVWSIRHLQEAAHIDGKAAANLRKLKLFKNFYIMIVAFIYFSRIMIFSLRITVPFQYQWLEQLFRETATFVFFVLTGYNFRPASANPYFTLSAEELAADDDDETDVVVSGKTAITEGLSKVNKVVKVNRPSTTEAPSTEEERDNLISKRESSHEYD